MFNIKSKKEVLQKEYTELNNRIGKDMARMRGIEGALEVLDEMEKEESKPNAEKNGDKQSAK